MNIKRYNLSQSNIKITKMTINNKSKVNCKGKINGGVNMGVSMGMIQPLTGKVAQDFLKDSEKSTISKETIKKCKELAKMITKRY